MDMDDGPLDFESEDPLLKLSLPTRKRKKKVIGLDDLLTNFYKEKSKIIEKESKKRNACEISDSDEEEDIRDENTKVFLSKLVDECYNQVSEIKSEQAISAWGLRVFGNQKTPPQVGFGNIERCEALQSFMTNELNGLLDLNVEEGQTFLEGLLVNGWLLEVAFTHGHVEESLATWTLNLMLYSSNEELRTSACDFWCTILTIKNEADLQPIRIDWLPSYADLKKALETYGYLLYSSTDFSSLSELKHTDTDSDGPPQNIRCLVKFLGACCQARNTRPIFSYLEAEEFLIVIICLFLDRQIQVLSVLLYECMLAVISLFADNEWDVSFVKVAEYLACRTQKDFNCLRLVDCISTIDTRSKQLRSEIALQILLHFFDTKVCDREKILTLLIKTNLKDKKCDLFTMYIYLVLTENWLFSNSLLEKKPFVLEMWGLFLRNCSCQIASSDTRPYASKVRNKASYLLQSTTS